MGCAIFYNFLNNFKFLLNDGFVQEDILLRRQAELAVT